MPPWPPGAGLPGKLTLRGGAGRPSRSGLSPSPLHLRFLLSRVESAFCWQWAVRAGERILSKVMGDGSGCWTTCILSEIGDELFQGPFPAFLYCTGWLFRSKLGTRSQPHPPFPHTGCSFALELSRGHGYLYLGTPPSLSRVFLHPLFFWAPVAHCLTPASTVVETQLHLPLVEMDIGCMHSRKMTLEI